QYTHAADAMARVVIRNALFFGRKTFQSSYVPHCTYTDPEVASVGRTDGAAPADFPVRTIRVPLTDVDRAVLDGETDGFAVVHVRGTADWIGGFDGTIIGATVVASHAGDLIQSIVYGERLGKFADVVRPYPTQGEVWKKVADAYQ